MQASKVTRDALSTAATTCGVRADIKQLNSAGTRFTVKLYPGAVERTPSGRRKIVNGAPVRAPYQRRKVSGPGMVHAVCWHGFRDWFRAVYAQCPDAIFRTAYATYRGVAGFESTFPDTAYRNIGSRMEPCNASDACYCEGEGTQPNGLFRTINVAACPHFIMVAEHYNLDGTCMCRNPHAPHMQEWGYAWDSTNRVWS